MLRMLIFIGVYKPLKSGKKRTHNLVAVCESVMRISLDYIKLTNIKINVTIYLNSNSLGLERVTSTIYLKLYLTKFNV